MAYLESLYSPILMGNHAKMLVLSCHNFALLREGRPFMSNLYHRHPGEYCAVRGTQIWIREHLHTSGLSVPVDLERVWPVARRIIISPDLPRAVKAASARAQHGDYIVLNTQYGALSQRFSIAHELVHLMRKHPPVESQALFFRELIELEANAGAAELLLPYDWFMAEAERRLGEPLDTINELKTYLTTADSRRWAAAARVSRAVLGRHLIDQDWVRRRPAPIPSSVSS